MGGKKFACGKLIAPQRLRGNESVKNLLSELFMVSAQQKARRSAGLGNFIKNFSAASRGKPNPARLLNSHSRSANERNLER